MSATTQAVSPSRRHIDAKAVGQFLGCSWRHVLRLADQGKLPWGFKLGALRRWDLHEIESPSTELATDGVQFVPGFVPTPDRSSTTRPHTDKTTDGQGEGGESEVVAVSAKARQTKEETR